MMRSSASKIFGLLTILLLILTGCASIPTGGGVGKVDTNPSADAGSINFKYTQQPPVPNADQKTIVLGFLDAANGIADNFQVAREYLTPAAALSWKSAQRTLVYQGEPSIVAASSSGEFNAQVKAQSSVDVDGVLTPFRSGTVESLKFGLVKVNGQWRINSLPDGIALASEFFADLFKSYSLYFYDPGFNYVVPDVRWLSGKGDSAAIGIVKALLKGPANYLKGAVASAFPDSTQLQADTVPIENSVATVDLTAKSLLDASPTARLQMQAQLLTTLQGGLNSVTSLRMRAGQDPIDLGSDPQSGNKLKPPSVASRQIGVSNNDLVYLENSQAGPIAGLESVAALHPSYPAQSYKHFAEGGSVAFLDATQSSLYTVAQGQQIAQPIVNQKLTPPSFAPSNWVWTAAEDGSGNVYAVYPGAQGGKPNPVVTLNVDWLKGRTVTSFRVSRDGTRALVVSVVNKQVQVQIAGILRQDVAAESAPRDLASPSTVYVDGSLVNQGYWAGESSVVLFASGKADVTPIDVELSGDSVELPALPALQRLSVGNTPSELFAQNSKGVLFQASANGWTELPVKGIRDPAFAG
ncbi:hypothetical protein FHU41_001129 [Psychromicrobium silvestre]|uniref:GerMN domain-containing protein n=1 Tax=Psychromicrobium silvestre TaxID=1645614 RepID=A0A7Y9S5G8_9MICC|nr:LpqB family beta-propeller domain-containing protein [Psychromicrobium silvestre]NYE94908.1 hypothetical protein [Psychromicrobium silvestre]